jgi:hypothetical protein
LAHLTVFESKSALINVSLHSSQLRQLIGNGTTVGGDFRFRRTVEAAVGDTNGSPLPVTLLTALDAAVPLLLFSVVSIVTGKPIRKGK